MHGGNRREKTGRENRYVFLMQLRANREATSCKPGNLLDLKIIADFTSSQCHRAIIADASPSPPFADAGYRTAKQPG